MSGPPIPGQPMDPSTNGYVTQMPEGYGPARGGADHTAQPYPPPLGQQPGEQPGQPDPSQAQLVPVPAPAPAAPPPDPAAHIDAAAMKSPASFDRRKERTRIAFNMGLLLNSRGYPARPGATNCQMYMDYGKCAFGVWCPLNHPDRATDHDQDTWSDFSDEREEPPKGAPKGKGKGKDKGKGK